jgi:hypothetical protein
LLFQSNGVGEPKCACPTKKEKERKKQMSKTKLLCVSLLLVFGLGLSASSAMAQGTLSATTTVYTLRPNSNAEALGPIYLTWVAGAVGTVAAGQSFNVLYSQPIVGAASISGLTAATAQADFCVTGATSTLSCTSLTVSATGSTLTLTNDTTENLTWTAGYIEIYGVRANTYGLAPSTPVTATIYTSVNPTYPWTFSNGTNVISTIVGTVSAVGALNITPYNVSGTEGTTYSCIGFPAPPPLEVGYNEMYVTATEQWAGAWTSAADEMKLAPFAPSATGTVTNGSEISIIVSGIPKLVTVTPKLVTNVFGMTWGTLPAAYTSPASGSSTTFDFVITNTNRPLPPTPVVPESATFYFELSSSGPLTTQANPDMTTSVQLDPAPSGTAYYPAFSYPPGGEEYPGVPYDIWSFPDCQTNLLFPYVTNYTNSAKPTDPEAAWDTALEVANMSSPPSAYIYAAYFLPTEGTCTFYLFSAGTQSTVTQAVTATPAASFVTPVILSGGIWANNLSAYEPGFAGGYAWAVCNFLYGAGYAAIADNAVVGPYQLYANYLAFNDSGLAYGYIDPPAAAVAKRAATMRALKPPQPK